MIIQKAANLFRKHFPVATCSVTQPYSLVFKTTHFCWYNCAHCCENCGPHQPRKFIPADTIKYYLDSACRDARFSGDVVFTGGEVMTAYRVPDAGENYVPDILTHALDAGMGVDIKTNAAWVNARFGGRIFDDLTAAAAMHEPYKLQVSLSLDNFHDRSLENNIKFISEMATRHAKILVHISTLNARHFVSPDGIYDGLRAKGMKVKDAVIISDDNQSLCRVANNSVVIRTGVGTLFQAGRATQIRDAEYQETPQFQILSGDYSVLMAFDASGLVTLGEAGRRKIHTHWRDILGNNLPMSVIHNKLFHSAIYEELRGKVLYR